MFRKAEEEITKAKETGMYHKSIRSQFKHNQLKAQNQKSSDRGLQVQIGRERNGVLHIHKRDIEAASQSSKPKKFKSGKGGSAGPGFKPNTKFGKGGKDRGSKVERMMNKYKF
ncbi:hypothetical protein CONCODRAFT_73774 [Conidiobolus coronatus NRRL 28638]|uniref:Uncharacterized protein n=1 Tax=Conidiobolus coronatus (strain ATCC 28846 / CBS 209.66 / NRRL 28638) TaxID=796925 RepID=A0A137NU91_CONC2|nr:hypothetical protein CONCODRAFT_73774 [Conidiobolus coronatus NRRL 28638]|eukprot:KXN66288.1 hypothetical protein CONCODRAFT_73774 [Conidiobolus coronatus NRRL 28638]